MSKYLFTEKLPLCVNKAVSLNNYAHQPTERSEQADVNRRQKQKTKKEFLPKTFSLH